MLLDLLKIMKEQDATDLHLRVGGPPYYRINKEMYPAQMDPLTIDQMWEIMGEMLDERQLELLREKNEVDGSMGVRELGRFRINAFLNRGSPGAVLRKISHEIPDLQTLQLPESLERIAGFRQGLVCVVGATGSGKSTTLAAIIHRINQTRRAHIITIEDPIEYLHRDIHCVITQREVGTDCRGFAPALRAALRQDPDIILVGEMRDAETVQIGIQASETGHVVFSTLHTNNASQTVDRMLKYFPPESENFMRLQLALYLKSVVAQKLVPRADGSGMIAACEIMFNSTVVAKMIRENRINMIKSVIHHSMNEGMQTFDQDLVSMVNDGLISFEVARDASEIPDSFQMAMKGFFSDISQSVFE